MESVVDQNSGSTVWTTEKTAPSQLLELRGTSLLAIDPLLGSPAG